MISCRHKHGKAKKRHEVVLKPKLRTPTTARISPSYHTEIVNVYAQFEKKEKMKQDV
jgi:hypothetical protein